MDDYLSKPINVQKLKAIIERFTQMEQTALIERTATATVIKSFNLETVLHRLGGNKELLLEVASIFLKDYLRMMSKIETAIELGDPTSIYNATHSLKGSISNFGAEQAVEKAQAILNTAKQTKNLKLIPTLYADLTQEIHKLVPALAAFIKECSKEKS
jgi:HPt (histidine-containing phosphotransfer) domain-containing protein